MPCASRVRARSSEARCAGDLGRPLLRAPAEIALQRRATWLTAARRCSRSSASQAVRLVELLLGDGAVRGRVEPARQLAELRLQRRGGAPALRA